MPLDIHRSGSPATGSGTDAAPAGLRSRRDFLGGVAVTFAAIATAPRRVAAHTPSLPDQPVFFRNVRLFDGRNPLRGGVGVLVRGTQIEAVDGRG